MGTAAVDAPVVMPAPARQLVPAAARLVVRAALGTALLGLLLLLIGPRLYPFQTFYVRSGSMSPVIPVGALVVATRAAADDIRPGDVIVFSRPDRPGTMIVHRVHSIESGPSGRVFVTKGDANSGPDAWRVPATGDGWRARYSMSGVGFAVGWLHAGLSRKGWAGTLTILAAVYALILIWRAEEPSP